MYKVAIRRDIKFRSRGGKCAGWLYIPDDTKTKIWPAVVLAMGFSTVKEMQGYVQPFAEAFTNAGFISLIFDYRFLGESSGEPRGQIFPTEQQEDIKNAISFLLTCENVNPDRIGLWGTSYGGAHVLQIAALDKRVKAVISQVPLVHGWHNAQRLNSENEFQELVRMLQKDREKRYLNNEVNYIKAVAPLGEQCLMSTPPSYDWFINAAKTAPRWENRVTLESIEKFLEYCPQNYISLIFPTPLLIIIGKEDLLTPSDLTLNAFAKAHLANKKCIAVDGGHFAPYEDPGRKIVINASIKWLTEHLI